MYLNCTTDALEELNLNVIERLYYRRVCLRFCGIELYIYSLSLPIYLFINLSRDSINQTYFIELLIYL